MSSSILKKAPERKFMAANDNDAPVHLPCTHMKMFLAVISFFVVCGMMLAILQGMTVAAQIKNMQKEVTEHRKVIEELLAEKQKHDLQFERPGNNHNRSRNNFEKTEIAYHNRVRRTSKNSRDVEVFIGAHLVGMTGFGLGKSQTFQQIPEFGHFFTWNSDDDVLSTKMLIKVVDENLGTFLVIRRPGYYYVYSQVTYYARGLHQIGHETVRLTPNDEIRLMSSVAMQVMGDAMQGSGNRLRNLDSSYHGGIFYLYRDDKLGVRSPNSHFANQHFHMEQTQSFFGAMFMHD